MIHCYAIKDEKVGNFMTPFFCRNIVDATRNLQVAVQDTQSSLHRFSTEFSLYFLFAFDDEAGTVLSEPPGPTFISKLEDFKPKTGKVAQNG